MGQPPTGTGFRPHPYTTDMAVNPHTYANTLTAAVPHGIGAIWAAMLWEVYWNLVDAHGFNPDLAQDGTTGGNNLALRLVSDGLKLQPCSPGFVDGRNAILAADMALTGGANQCLIWQGFAKRGLGFSASQGSANSNADNVAAFDMPLSCQSLNATPLSQDVCQGTAAVYTLTANGAFTGTVQLSAVGNPSPSMVDFSVNPITAPGSSEMTIDNTGGVAVGNYTITATGDDGIWADSAEVELNILAGAPSPP
ncbi:MAG: M36 family metallopeptidase [Chloroflexi bacterium]|nr:M36 family metallopeptidase [Chloroflexota bacterium]